MIGVLCLALLDARGWPCRCSWRARSSPGRKKAGLKESNVSLIQLSYMAPLLTQSLLRHGIFSWYRYLPSFAAAQGVVQGCFSDPRMLFIILLRSTPTAFPPRVQTASSCSP